MKDRSKRADLKEIRRFLGQHHLTQRQLAELAGLQPVTVNRWLKGRTLPYLGHWNRIRAVVLDKLENESTDGWQQLLTKPALRVELGFDSLLLERLRKRNPALFERPLSLSQVRHIMLGVLLGLSLKEDGNGEAADS